VWCFPLPLNDGLFEMAIISPFRSVHYNGSCAGQLDRLIAPPYDVISPEEQESLYQLHDLNIIRLVLGKEFPDDRETDNRYTRAASTLREWMSKGVLTSTERPAVVVYQLEFDIPDGGRRTLDGIIVLVKVEEYGKGRVLPHEKTYIGPRAEQLNLLRATHAHLTPIHALFNDRSNVVMDAYGPVMQRSPDQEAVEGGTVHRTWALYDEEAISKIVSLLADKSLFVADGHHRYETSLAFRNEIRAKGSVVSKNGHEYVMMYLTSTSHPGLTILPAHRLVGGLGGDVIDGIVEKLAPYFDFEDCGFTCCSNPVAAQEMIKRISPYSTVVGNFGMILGGEGGCKILRLKSFEGVDPIIDPSVPGPLRELDVTILRDVVVSHGLGMDRDIPEGHIEYTPSVAKAMEKVNRGEIQIAFILNPTRVEQVQVAAELGHKLPHKSTYFYPKLASGLALNVF
jgi:uncharacterized protein (DUF1015 family)